MAWRKPYPSLGRAKMKWLLVLGIFTHSCAQASQPSTAAIISCISDYSISPEVSLHAFPSEFSRMENYKFGYKTSYYFIFHNKIIGYAEKKSNYGIIFDEKIYPINSAKRLLGTRFQPTNFNPFAAQWSTVIDKTGQYLCISFPFGALGLNGSFQKTRGAYLLHTKGRSKTLFFAVANIDLHK